MDYIVIILVCVLSSLVGAICGIGGGVIIKPVLDALGIMSVATASFLSGCTVLAMSFISLYKRLKDRQSYHFDKVIGTTLAVGAVCGGLLGKEIFRRALQKLPETDSVGAVQAIVLFLCTVGTLLYMKNKERIRTKHISNKVVTFSIGLLLGTMSSFLGIGGGPINLVVLFFFFSMESKQAALYSIYIIMFSQVSNLLFTIAKGDVPPYKLSVLVLMIVCGIAGGLLGNVINKKLNHEKVDKLFGGVLFVIACISVYNIFRYL